MSVEVVRQVERALGPGWECGSVVRLPGERIRLHLKAQGTFDPFSRLLVVEADTLQLATEQAARQTGQLSPQALMAEQQFGR